MGFGGDLPDDFFAGPRRRRRLHQVPRLRVAGGHCPRRRRRRRDAGDAARRSTPRRTRRSGGAVRGRPRRRSPRDLAGRARSARQETCRQSNSARIRPCSSPAGPAASRRRSRSNSPHATSRSWCWSAVRRVPAEEPADTAGLTTQAEIKAALMKRRRTRSRPQSRRPTSGCSRTARFAANLEAIRAAGGTVEYRAVDVRDAAAFGGLIDELNAAGGITGVIHGAGVIEDKLLRDKTPESFDRVFGTKVDSAWTLARKLDPAKARSSSRSSPRSRAATATAGSPTTRPPTRC